MPVVIAVMFGLLGFVGVASGALTIINRRRMSSNIAQAGVIRGSKVKVALYVIVLGVVQISVGGLLLGLALVLPDRAEKLRIDAVIFAIILRMGQWSTIAAAVTLGVGIVFCIVSALQIRRFWVRRANGTPQDPIRRNSLPHEFGITIGIVMLVIGIFFLGGGN